jgi:hypothetical protein
VDTDEEEQHIVPLTDKDDEVKFEVKIEHKPAEVKDEPKLEVTEPTEITEGTLES